jgi:hypothetical protein
MSKLYKFNTKTFPFDELSLANPNGVQGGAYLAKLKLASNKFLIQTPSSTTKKGVIKTDKKMYCDLMFDNDDEKIQDFIATLEDAVKNLIYAKKDIWFHTEMDMDTIDYHWQSSLRGYQGDKVLLRCFIKKPKNIINQNTPTIQIYDEDENKLDLDSINKDSTVISVISIDGLKFTPQSFSLGFSLEQIMVLKDDHKNNKCLIKINDIPSTINQPDDVTEITTQSTQAQQISPDSVSDVTPDSVSDVTPDSVSDVISDSVSDVTPDNVEELPPKSINGINNPTSLTLKDLAISNDTNQDKLKENEQSLEDNSILHEADIKIPENNKTSVSLKKPNEVYIEIYSEVKRRAKEAKLRALAAELEVKRVKALYMLDDIDSSSSDDGSENSESEDAELSN